MSESKWIFRHITANYSACSMNGTPNLGRYVASTEAVSPPSKPLTMASAACSVNDMPNLGRYVASLGRFHHLGENL